MRGVLLPSYPIETDRLLLRPFAPSDHAALLAIHSREEVTRYIYWAPRGPEEVSEVLADKIAGAKLEQLGMRREAHLVENEWVKGEWTDEAIYGMLDREWEARAGS